MMKLRISAPLALAAFFLAPLAHASDEKPAESKKPVYDIQPPPATFAPPVLSVEQPVFDWDTVMQGEIVTHEFILKNTGGSPLQVERVKPACGCTTVNFDSVIQPGQTGQVTLKVDTQKFSGTIKKTASVFTNASREAVTLSMTGKIETALEWTPPVPRFDIVKGMATEPLLITLNCSKSKNVSVTGVTVDEKSADVLAAKLEEVAAGATYKLTCTPLNPDSTKKYSTVEVVAHCEMDGKKVDVPINVSLTIRDRVEATPPSVYFTVRDTKNLEAGAGPVTREVKITTRDPAHQFKIIGAKVDGTHFSVDVQPIEAGKEYRLTTTLLSRPEGDQRRVVEKIRVETDDPLNPEITLNATASFGLRATATKSP